MLISWRGGGGGGVDDVHSVQKRGSYNKDYRNTLTVVLSDTAGLTDADTLTNGKFFDILE